MVSKQHFLEPSWTLILLQLERVYVFVLLNQDKHHAHVRSSW